MVELLLSLSQGIQGGDGLLVCRLGVSGLVVPGSGAWDGVFGVRGFGFGRVRRCAWSFGVLGLRCSFVECTLFGVAAKEETLRCM